MVVTAKGVPDVEEHSLAVTATNPTRASRNMRVAAMTRATSTAPIVRVPSDPRSTLYNTDGQIFSDAGVPVVLFVENYDINRTGYHVSLPGRSRKTRPGFLLPFWPCPASYPV
jgi:hypothetical protein